MTEGKSVVKEDPIDSILRESGAVLRGHFVFTAGDHGDMYVNKDALYVSTAWISRLCQEAAPLWGNRGVETVIGPATGGIILSQWVAHHLSLYEGRTVHAIYADKRKDVDGKETKEFSIGRGYDQYVHGKKVLCVEDILNSGGSARKLVDCVREYGGGSLGVWALVNRGGVTRADLNVEYLDTLRSFKANKWPERKCLLCKQGIAISTNVGHGAKFLAKQNKS